MYKAARTLARPPQNPTLAPQQPAVPVKWRKADQVSDALAVQNARFGKIGHDRNRCHWTNSFHDLEQIIFGTPK